MVTRRRMLRAAAAGLALAGGAALLAACGAPGGASTSTPTASAAAAAGTSSTPTASAVKAGTTAGATPTASTSSVAALGATPTPMPGAPTPTPQPTPVAIAKGSGSKQVLLWHNYTQQDYNAFASVIDDFVAQHGDFKIDAEYQPTSSGSQENEKLITAIAGGKPPDVAMFDRFIVGSFAFRGALNDLSSMATQSKIMADQFLPFAWDEASLDGKLYALPIDTDARALYYNKEMFDKAGLKPPTTPEELDAATEKLTEKSSSGFTRLGFIPNESQGMLYTWGWVWGGSFYDKTTRKVTSEDPKIVDALTWMQGYAKKYGEEKLTSFSSAFGQGAQSPFVAGLLAMEANGNWELSTIKQYAPDLHYGVVPFPHPAGVKATTWSGGWAWTLPKGSKHVDDGFTLASFMTNDDEALKWNKATSHFPTRIKALKDPAFAEGDNKVFADLLPDSHNRPVIPEGNLLWNDLLTATSNVMYGKAAPKDALAAVDTKVNDQLEKDGWFKK